MTRKIRVGILFGGRSGEHEVSLASASSVLAALDPERYEAVGIGITRDGTWLMSDNAERLLSHEIQAGLPETVEVAPAFAHHTVVPVDGSGDRHEPEAPIDIVIPLLHGPYGEDGTIQGFLEIAGIPYVGSGVMASAVGMDKVVMKNLFAHAGLPQVQYRLVRAGRWKRDPSGTMTELEAGMQYPMFVKPCNLGSSVGISKAHTHEELRKSLDLAATYDARIIVEQGVDAREVECSVMGNDDPIVSVAGEVVAHRDFYDYEAKYTDGLAELVIPAQLTPEQSLAVQNGAREAYRAIDACGLARVDFFVRRSDGAVLINEINTMPGFTATSMYPRLWEASGVPMQALVDRLIAYAFERHERRARLSTER
ncbi:MAG: D-alanine--D-alanine ligase family protein [Chloroflexota bacterium]